MSRFDTDLVIPPTLVDYCAARRRVEVMMNEASRLYVQADDELEKLMRYGLPYDGKPRDSVKGIMKQVDQRMWRAAFDLTEFNRYMDKKARQEFERTLNDNPPEFNEENVKSIFLSAFQDADMMFARGLVEVFLNLSKRYETNKKCAFKVEKKVIIDWMLSPSWSRGLEVKYQNQDKLNDIDRVFKVLDKKPYEPRALEFAINKAFKEGNLYEDEYYKIRGYRKGTMHIEFKRNDLLEAANKVISDYYNGQALGVKQAA